MENQLYRETLLEAAKSPQNRGELKKADFEAKMVNPLCGDEVKIQIKLGSNQIIRKAVFSGNGCAISQAGAALLTQNIEGKKISEVKKLDSDDILSLIGINPTPSRFNCAILGLDVLKEALNGVQSKG